MHYDLALGGLSHVNHPLHHIICILVLHHGVEGTVRAVLLTADFIDEQGPLCTGRMNHTLLYNITVRDRHVYKKKQGGQLIDSGDV